MRLPIYPLRGGLIEQFILVIARLDPVATAAVTEGGFDKEFNEMVPVKDGTSLGGDSRKEMAEIKVHAQIDRKDADSFNKSEPTRGGNQEMTKLIFTLHMRELEDRGLVDANNMPVFRSMDRVDRIEDLDGDTVWKWSYPPGLMIDDVVPAGYGLAFPGTSKFNLAQVRCSVPAENRPG